MRCKIFNTKRIKEISVFFALMLLSPVVYSGDIVPNTFQSGDIVSASKINANFTALENATQNAIDYLTITIRENGSSGNVSSWVTSELISVSCNHGELLVGGVCSCAHADFTTSNTNLGWVAACGFSSNGVLGFTATDLSVSDSWKNGPPITVQAVCASATLIGASSFETLDSTSSNIEPILSVEDELIINRTKEQQESYIQLLEKKLLDKQ